MSAQLAGEARRRLARGHLAPSPHQGRWALPCVREGGPRQEGVRALAGPTPGGREMALGAEQRPRGMPTVRASQALRVEMLCEPNRAEAVIQALVDRKVSHQARIPHPAR